MAFMTALKGNPYLPTGVFKLPRGVWTAGNAVIPRLFVAGVFASVPQGILAPV